MGASAFAAATGVARSLSRGAEALETQVVERMNREIERRTEVCEAMCAAVSRR
jgi:hypothetical protein